MAHGSLNPGIVPKFWLDVGGFVKKCHVACKSALIDISEVQLKTD